MNCLPSVYVCEQEESRRRREEPDFEGHSRESRLEDSERGEEEEKKNSCRRQRRGTIGIDSYAKRATRAATVTVMADHPIPDILLPVPTGEEMFAASSAENASEAEAKEWEQKHEEGGEGKQKKKKKKKLLGKKKEGEEEEYTVPFFKLFSYADSYDHLLMVVGTVGAIANGLAMPLMTIVFGSLTNAFGNNQSDNSVLVHAVSKVRVPSLPSRSLCLPLSLWVSASLCVGTSIQRFSRGFAAAAAELAIV